MTLNLALARKMAAGVGGGGEEAAGGREVWSGGRGWERGMGAADGGEDGGRD